MITVTGLFDTRAQAEEAIDALHERGIEADDISVIMRGRHGAEERRDDHDDDVSAAEGAGIGAVEGGVIGLLAGLGALTIPGIGPIVAVGPLVGALTGIIAGGATGGLVAALIDSGVEEADAEAYRDGLERGAVLLTVRTDEADAAEVRAVMDQYSRPLEEHRERWEEEPEYRYDEVEEYEEAEAVDVTTAATGAGATQVAVAEERDVAVEDEGTGVAVYESTAEEQENAIAAETFTGYDETEEQYEDDFVDESIRVAEEEEPEEQYEDDLIDESTGVADVVATDDDEDTR
ncbi:MAG: hypothetical protein M3220_09750 [Chloroflexota bacterium]|nr:hypothetical protein [Chloroflexota bacterium]